MKSGIRSDKIVPAAAIVDPVYTLSLPMNVTMESGFDVFAHAAESYCAVRANLFSEMLSEKAIRIVGEALPRLYKDMKDEEARGMMSFAGHIMGCNVKNIGNCLPHRLQYPIGAETGTSHGAGLIALYPAWIKYEHMVNAERVDKILGWLECGGGSAEERIRGWLRSMQLDRTITDLGNTFRAEELAMSVTGDLNNDKLAEKEDILVKLYRESM